MWSDDAHVRLAVETDERHVRRPVADLELSPPAACRSRIIPTTLRRADVRDSRRHARQTRRESRSPGPPFSTFASEKLTRERTGGGPTSTVEFDDAVRSPVRALVLEDDVRLRSLVVRTLTRTGLACDEASRIEEADELLSLHEYDLLVLDRRLPDGDGLDVCRKSRATAASPVRS